MVAPMGRTKEEILLDTPALFSTQRIVTGNVALEELVENAVARAEAIAEKCFRGFMPVNR